MPLKHHFTDRGEGPVLVLIHGAYIDSKIWKYQLPHFEKNWRVINYDLRGHGLTSRDESVPEYSVSLFAEDLYIFLKERGVEEAYLCGLSLGSMIAQAFAARHPEMCAGLALVGTSASFRNTVLEKLVLTFVFPKWLAFQLFGRLTTRQFMKLAFFMTWFAYGRKWLGTKQTRLLIKECMQRMHRSEIKKAFAALHGFRRQDLDTGNYPILILIGEYDSRLLQYHSRTLHKRLGQRSGLIEINNAGHACNVDQPEKFNRLLEQWMLQHVRLPEEVVL